MVEKIKFKCKGCGNCCSVFKEEETKTDGLPLREWEIEKFSKIAEEKGIKINIQPVEISLDKRSGLYFTTDFKQVIEPCPFLDENKKCSIYSSRPIVCKQYPINKNPLIFHSVDLGHIGKCPSFDAKNFYIEVFGAKEGQENKITKKKSCKEFLECFCEEIFVNSLITGWYQAFVEKTIEDLISQRTIKLRKVSRMDYSKIKALSFFDFLIKIGKINKEEKERMIGEVFSYEKNKEILYDFINEPD